MCRMDAAVENPGARRFDRDLRTWVPKHRPELVTAALTVLRAFVIAGRPGLDKLEPYGRFEDWSNLVRGALVWLGEPDPCITRKDIDAHDPEREALGALLRAWRVIFGVGQSVTAKMLVEKADVAFQTEIGGDGATAKEQLGEALEGLTSQWHSPKSLGRVLSKFAGRIVDGARIREYAVSGKPKAYRLEVVAAE